MKYLATIAAALLGSAKANFATTEALLEAAVESTHPRVGAQANKVSIESVGNVDYHGQVYVGSGYEETYVIYDTMQEETIIFD